MFKCEGDDCPSHAFMCANGKCIPQTKVCDGIVDCEDNTDETEICKGTIECFYL